MHTKENDKTMLQQNTLQGYFFCESYWDDVVKHFQIVTKLFFSIGKRVVYF